MNGNVDSTDVVVWGGGTGGVAAAIQASRYGARTLLLTPGTWLGGMVSAAGCVAPMATNSLHGKPVSGERFSENWNRPNQRSRSQLGELFGYRPSSAEAILQVGAYRVEAALVARLPSVGGGAR